MGLAGARPSKRTPCTRQLLSVDQIDSIVSESNISAGVDEAHTGDSERKARSIFATLAGGLMDLHDCKKRAMTIVGCLEGFKVEGSAESVGRHTTSSVVQSIFLVIVFDALFAMFYMEMAW